jgi:hypothetical protein
MQVLTPFPTGKKNLINDEILPFRHNPAWLFRGTWERTGLIQMIAVCSIYYAYL